MTMRDAAGGRNPKALGAVFRLGDCRSALRQPFLVVLMALALVGERGSGPLGGCP